VKKRRVRDEKSKEGRREKKSGVRRENHVPEPAGKPNVREFTVQRGRCKGN